MLMFGLAWCVCVRALPEPIAPWPMAHSPSDSHHRCIAIAHSHSHSLKPERLHLQAALVAVLLEGLLASRQPPGWPSPLPRCTCRPPFALELASDNTASQRGQQSLALQLAACFAAWISLSLLPSSLCAQAVRYQLQCSMIALNQPRFCSCPNDSERFNGHTTRP